MNAEEYYIRHASDDISIHRHNRHIDASDVQDGVDIIMNVEDYIRHASNDISMALGFKFSESLL